jgi:cytochrome c oxidase assembly protein subunit 11
LVPLRNCFIYLLFIYLLERNKMNSTAVREANKRRLLVGKLFLIVGAMFLFGYALVPLYNVFCDITGLNGKTKSEPVVTAKAGTVDTSRTITVELLANVNSQLAWEFQPEVRKVQVHPGETIKVTYYASNLTDRPVTGQAVPSVSPGKAAKHLHKTECFCFTEQILQAGETREMPVVFFVDPELPPNYSVVTLSYTFFDISNRASAQLMPSG